MSDSDTDSSDDDSIDYLRIPIEETEQVMELLTATSVAQSHYLASGEMNAARGVAELVEATAHENTELMRGAFLDHRDDVFAFDSSDRILDILDLDITDEGTVKRPDDDDAWEEVDID